MSARKATSVSAEAVRPTDRQRQKRHRQSFTLLERILEAEREFNQQ
jgi:hypothetical protein